MAASTLEFSNSTTRTIINEAIKRALSKKGTGKNIATGVKNTKSANSWRNALSSRKA
jgi:hypothetical protein